MKDAVSLTLNEAGYVIGRSRATINRAVDQGVIDERLKRLEQVKALVDESVPEPVLCGADVPVRIVAALARGQSTIEIVEDYPILTVAQVEAEIEYAKVYPRTGRPLPTRSLKRMLRDVAAAGVWDLESDSSGVEPQPIP